MRFFLFSKRYIWRYILEIQLTIHFCTGILLVNTTCSFWRAPLKAKLLLKIGQTLSLNHWYSVIMMKVNANNSTRELCYWRTTSPLRFCSLIASSSHQLLFSQSLLIVRIDVRHLGHLCVVDLHLSKQKGMRQQPATQLQKKEQEQYKTRKHMTVTTAAQTETDPTRCNYILMQNISPGCRKCFHTQAKLSWNTPARWRCWQRSRSLSWWTADTLDTVFCMDMVEAFPCPESL